jgi:hypothetical protein
MIDRLDMVFDGCWLKASWAAGPTPPAVEPPIMYDFTVIPPEPGKPVRAVLKSLGYKIVGFDVPPVKVIEALITAPNIVLPPETVTAAVGA